MTEAFAKLKTEGNAAALEALELAQPELRASMEPRSQTPYQRYQAAQSAVAAAQARRHRAVDGLMTNFHLPKSTLFMLVSALMGRERMQAIYAHAIAQGYRFYSYGDSSLLLPEK